MAEAAFKSIRSKSGALPPTKQQSQMVGKAAPSATTTCEVSDYDVYLRETVGRPLTKAVAETLLYRPTDPCEMIASWTALYLKERARVEYMAASRAAQGVVDDAELDYIGDAVDDDEVMPITIDKTPSAAASRFPMSKSRMAAGGAQSMLSAASASPSAINATAEDTVRASISIGGRLVDGSQPQQSRTQVDERQNSSRRASQRNSDELSPAGAGPPPGVEQQQRRKSSVKFAGIDDSDKKPNSNEASQRQTPDGKKSAVNFALPTTPAGTTALPKNAHGADSTPASTDVSDTDTDAD